MSDFVRSSCQECRNALCSKRSSSLQDLASALFKSRMMIKVKKQWLLSQYEISNLAMRLSAMTRLKRKGSHGIVGPGPVLDQALTQMQPRPSSSFSVTNAAITQAIGLKGTQIRRLDP